MANSIPYPLVVRKEKTASVVDLQMLRFPQNHVECLLRTELRGYGLNERAAELGGLLAALVARGSWGSYQIDQRHIAAKLSSLLHTPLFSRNYISELEHSLARLGYLEIPRHKFRPDAMRTKVRRFTDKFVALIQRCIRPRATNLENMISVAGSDIEQSVVYSQESQREIFKPNPVRVRVENIIEYAKTTFARPSRPTLFDTNHRRALEAKGVFQTKLGRIDRQFLFHTQKAIPDDVRALEFFVDTIRKREAGDVEIVAFFERWPRLRKAKRTSAVIHLCGNNYLGGMGRRELQKAERDFLFYVQKSTPALLNSIKFFVDVLRLRRQGNELVHRFFVNWDDLLSASKPGMVTDLRRSLGDVLPPDVRLREYVRPPPTKDKDKERRDAVFDGLPDSMSESEHVKLLDSLLFGVAYAGSHAEILARLKAMSTLELENYLEWVDVIQQKSPADGRRGTCNGNLPTL